MNVVQTQQSTHREDYGDINTAQGHKDTSSGLPDSPGLMIALYILIIDTTYKFPL